MAVAAITHVLFIIITAAIFFLFFVGTPTNAFHAYKEVNEPSFYKNQEPSSSANIPSHKGNEIVAVAKQYIGTPYQWGGGNPKGFDCSGFVQFVMSQVGISIPRITYEQYQTGSPVKREQLQKGDLVFFQTTAPGATHVGIYAGNDLFIQADETKGVKFSSLQYPYWKNSYLGARRLVQHEYRKAPYIR